MLDFWRTKNQWFSTWPKDAEARSMVVYVFEYRSVNFFIDAGVCFSLATMSKCGKSAEEVFLSFSFGLLWILISYIWFF